MADQLPLAAEFRFPPSARHTCRHCETIVIDPVSARAEANPLRVSNSFRFTMEAAFRADHCGCPVFQKIISATKETEREVFKSYLRSQLFSSFPRQEVPRPLLRITLDLELDQRQDEIHKAVIKWAWDDENLVASRVRSVGSFTVDCEKDDVASEYIVWRPEYPYLESRDTFTFIRNCMEECKGHPNCVGSSAKSNFQNDSQGPSRLVFVGGASPRIVSVAELEYKADYLALSYCWGGDDSMKLTRTTIGPWTESFLFTELPRTLRDTITFARHLGMEYVWIDRLCIIQDDPEDMTVEIAAMPRIYGGAKLTLSVSWAKTSRDGFLFSAEESHRLFRKNMFAVRYRCPNGRIGLVTLTPIEDWGAAHHQEAIDYRAWTLQEQMLSPRVLRFSSYYLRWTCKSIRGIYRNWGFRTTTLEDNLDKPRESLTEWLDIVDAYSRRHMSNSGEKFMASSAIASQYHQKEIALNTPTRYIAGLWEHQLPEALTWFTKVPAKSIAYLVDGQILVE